MRQVCRWLENNFTGVPITTDSSGLKSIWVPKSTAASNRDSGNTISVPIPSASLPSIDIALLVGGYPSGTVAASGDPRLTHDLSTASTLIGTVPPDCQPSAVQAPEASSVTREAPAREDLTNTDQKKFIFERIDCPTTPECKRPNGRDVESRLDRLTDFSVDEIIKPISENRLPKISYQPSPNHISPHLDSVPPCDDDPPAEIVLQPQQANEPNQHNSTEIRALRAEIPEEQKDISCPEGSTRLPPQPALRPSRPLTVPVSPHMTQFDRGPGPARGLDRIRQWQAHNEIVTIARISTPRVRKIKPVRKPKRTPAKLQKLDFCVHGDQYDDSILKLSDPNGAFPEQNFRFDRVFKALTPNEKVFDEITPMLEGFLDGFRIAVSVDGYSGSGKSFTLLNGKDALVPAAVRFVLRRKKELCPEKAAKVLITVGQIFANKLLDLMPEALMLAENREFTKVETPRLGWYCLDRLSTILWDPTHYDDIEHWCKRLDASRVSRSTPANEQSSRSHMILVITDADIQSPQSNAGSLVFMDICGQEDPALNVLPHARSEYQHINNDRAAYHHVLKALSRGKHPDSADVDQRELSRSLVALLYKDRTKFICIFHLLWDRYRENTYVLNTARAISYSGSEEECRWTESATCKS